MPESTVTETLAKVRVVLVRPKGSGNIGSVARAMKNTGLRELALVGGGRTESLSARSMAVHARDILDGARRFGTIREAVADCGLVVGTTCRKGLYRDHVELPREMARDMVAAVAGPDAPPAALLFGPEDHGLSNADLRHCQRLVTIPSQPEQPSLNLAQAVMVCLYEIYVAATLGAPREERLKRAPAEAVEALFDRMKDTLLKVGFLDPQNPEHILLALRRVLGRAGLEERDVKILSGLFRQVEWYAQGGWEVAEEKRRQGVKLR